jgi:uncharacterized membrane protein
MTRSSESGSITVMTIGFLLLIGLLTVVVVDSSAAFLRRLNLNNLADGAALAAADGLDEQRFYEDRQITLNVDDVESLVDAYVAGEHVRVVRVQVIGDRVHVRLEQDLELPLVPPGWVSGAVVVAEANAQIRQQP